MAWAIQVQADRPAWIGVGWFDWALARPGLSTMTFATRQDARAAIRRVRTPYGFPRARVVRVRVTVEEAARHA